MSLILNKNIWPAFHSRPTVSSKKAVIAAGHYMAAAAGIRMIAKGGNAIDAGIAAAFALVALRPHQNGIGGESPALIYSPKEKKTFAISGVGTAPKALTIEGLKKRGISSIPGFGYLGAIVPAHIGALCTALQRFGTLPLDEILAPAIEICYDGFPVYEGLREFLSTACDGLFINVLPENGKIFLKNGKAPLICDLVKQPDLGATYEKLADAYKLNSKTGRDAGIMAAINRFYRGDIAEMIINYVRSFPVEDAMGNNSCPITLEDFASYETRVEEAASVRYRNFQVFKCGPWTQGPVLLETLKILEGFDLKKMGHNSAQYIHTLVESMKLSFNDRNRYYGDPLFSDIPLDWLLSPEYASEKRALIDPFFANNTKMWDDDLFITNPEKETGAKGDTTHLDCVDSEGFMISLTPSGGWIQSNPRVPGIGLQLSTRGQMFYMKQGHPNSLVPGKRPRATLTPSLAFKDGKPWMAFGSPGGDNQDQWSLQTFLNIAEFDMSLQDAIDASTFHIAHFRDSFYPHNAYEGYVFHEPLSAPIVNDLISRQHKMVPFDAYSNGEALAVAINHKNGMIEGAASPKQERQSYAMGW